MMHKPMLPCPFCGETPVLTKHYKFDSYSFIHRCPVLGPVSWDFREEADSHVEQWNKRAALADPVPPAGGEPLIHINPAVLSMLRGEVKSSPGGITFSLSEPVGGWTVPLYEQHVVTRLKAEVERQRNHFREQLRDAKNADALQAELTKARELLADVAKKPWMYDVLGSVREYVAKQSAPAVKDESHEE